MADVLLGRTDGIEGFQRHVVLKRIRPEFARDPRFIRMFLDEARLAANLHHHNIVQVHDVGQEGGEYFLAMEHIHGEDVRSVLATASRSRTHVPLAHTMAIVAGAAAGLHYAHERRGPDNRPLGIVHRDVSPSNLLVGYDGSVKVVDFGIAKASAQDETRSGHLRGKISYMSPEQCKGEPVDRRSDVYALGVVLYELATTTRLFKGDNDYRVMDAIVHGRVPSPRARRPDLPEALAAIILRALSPDRERRYFTAEELRLAIEQLVAKTGLSSSPAELSAYMRKQFGEVPEPWLELADKFSDAFVPEPAPEAASHNSWTEMPRSSSFSSSSSIPKQTGPLPVAAERAPDEPAIPPTPPAAAKQAPWSPPATPRRSPARLALIAAPLLLVAGFAVWKLTSSSGAPAPAVAVAPARPAPAPVAAPPAPAPVAAPVEPIATSAHTAGASLPAAPAPIARAVPPTRAAAPPHVAPDDDERSAELRARTRVAAAAPRRSVEPTPTPAPPAAPTPVISHPAPAVTRAAVTQPTPAITPPAPAVTHPAPAPTAQPSVAPPGSAQPAPAPPPAAVATQPAAPAPEQAPPAVAAPAAPPPTVATLDANRISGEPTIAPDDRTQIEINRRGLDRVIGIFKVCLSVTGDIASVNPLKSTGFAEYDWKISTAIRNKWRYRPFLVAGKPSAVCTSVRFIYSQH
jgi:serine/threonine-protein kinase